MHLLVIIAVTSSSSFRISGGIAAHNNMLLIMWWACGTVAMNIAQDRWWFCLVYDSYGMGIWRSFLAMLSAPLVVFFHNLL